MNECSVHFQCCSVPSVEIVASIKFVTVIPAAGKTKCSGTSELFNDVVVSDEAEFAKLLTFLPKTTSQQ